MSTMSREDFTGVCVKNRENIDILSFQEGKEVKDSAKIFTLIPHLTVNRSNNEGEQAKIFRRIWCSLA